MRQAIPQASKTSSHTVFLFLENTVRDTIFSCFGAAFLISRERFGVGAVRELRGAS